MDGVGHQKLMITDIQWNAIQRIVVLIAERQYEEAVQFCRGSRLNAEDIKGAVVTYGRTIVPLPQTARSLTSSIRISKAVPPRWSVVVPLFTIEEDRSDLSLELTISEPEPGCPTIQLDGLHVL